MRYRRLGDSGLAVSVVGIGCNNFGRKVDADGHASGRRRRARRRHHPVRHRRHLRRPPGGSEERARRGAAAGRRDEVIVATKFGMDMHGAQRRRTGAPAAAGATSIRAVEASLRRLGTDYIDLYQLHQPDPATPIEETLAALDDLVRAGKVRYLGNSNFAGWQIADAAWTAADHAA